MFQMHMLKTFGFLFKLFQEINLLFGPTWNAANGTVIFRCFSRSLGLIIFRKLFNYAGREMFI